MNVGLLGFGTEDDISVGTAELQDALNGSPPSHFTPPPPPSLRSSFTASYRGPALSRTSLGTATRHGHSAQLYVRGACKG
jgi:hypothetical protein